jgi:hypothetical protein
MPDHPVVDPSRLRRSASFPYLAAAVVALFCVVLGVIAVMEGVPPMAVVLSAIAVAGVTISALRKDPDAGR